MAREECPVFPGEAQRHHWPFQDPATFTETGEARLDAFRKLRDRPLDEVVERIRDAVAVCLEGEGAAE
jgi:hypothetical protein